MIIHEETDGVAIPEKDLRRTASHNLANSGSAEIRKPRGGPG